MNHPEIPKDAMYVMCKNKEVDQINEEKLEMMSGENIEIKATHSQSHQKLPD